MIPTYTRVRLLSHSNFHPKGLIGEEGDVVGYTEHGYLVKIPYLRRVLECIPEIVEIV